METILDFIKETVKPVNFTKELLKEAGPNDDPFGGDASGAPDLGGAPDAGGAPADMGDAGGMPFGDAGMGPGEEGDAGFENAETEEQTDDDQSEETKDPDDIDLSEYEDDKDWTQGIEDSDNVMLPKAVAGEVQYDNQAILKRIKQLRSTLSAQDLKDFDKVSRCFVIISNGKVLKDDDVMYDDPEHAVELINKVLEPIDKKTRNYYELKLKQPLIKMRDANKQQMAALAANNDYARDTIAAVDGQKK